VPKSTIDVQLKGTEQIKNYADMMQEFRKLLGAMPSDWDKTTRAAAKVGKPVMDQTAALLAQQQLLRDQRKLWKEQDKQERELEKTEKRRAENWKKLGGHVTGAAKGIVSMTANLFKWAGLGTVISGITSGFGFMTLANAAFDMRRQAAMLGTTPAELQAAKAVLTPFGDPQAMLGGIAQAQAQLGARWAFGAVGMPGAWMGDPGQNLPALMRRARALMPEMAPEGQIISDLPITQAFTQLGLPLETLRVIQHMDPKELEDTIAKYKKLAADTASALNPGVLKQWNDFQISMAEARVKIEAALIQVLSPLAGPLGQLADTIADILKGFLASGQLQQWIADFGATIKYWATWLQNTNNQKWLEDTFNRVLTDLNIFAIGLEKIINLFPHDTGAPPGYPHPTPMPKVVHGTTDPNATYDQPGGYWWVNPATGTKHWHAPERGHFQDWAKGVSGWFQNLFTLGGNLPSAGGTGQVGMINAAGWLTSYMMAHGVKPEVAKGIGAGAYGEGGLLGANNPKSGAFAMGQWLGIRKKRLMALFGPNPTREQQAAFMLWELMGGDPGGASVLNSKTAQEALHNFIVNFMRPHKGFETERDLAAGSNYLSGRIQPSAHHHVLHVTITQPLGSNTTVHAGQLAG
jgi:hypothetical protein